MGVVAAGAEPAQAQYGRAASAERAACAGAGVGACIALGRALGISLDRGEMSMGELGEMGKFESHMPHSLTSCTEVLTSSFVFNVAYGNHAPSSHSCRRPPADRSSLVSRSTMAAELVDGYDN